MMQLCRFGVRGVGNPSQRSDKEGDMGQRIREKQEDAGVVPVTENGRLIGMVTDRDRAISVVAEGTTHKGDNAQTGQVVQEISE
jgi:hypothetical protein